MLDYHIDKKADLTVAAISYPRDKSSAFGICQVDDKGKMIGFEEKPLDPKPIPGMPHHSLVSMGNYIFNKEALKEILEEDANDPDSVHDFGKNIIPKMTAMGNTYVYDYNNNHIPGNPRETNGQNYWRDVGTTDQFFDCSMDILSVTPPFNLYNPDWPVLASQRNLPPAKFVFANVKHSRIGHALDSMIAEGCIISGGVVSNSLLFPNVRVNSYSTVDECVIFEGVDIGRYCKLRRVIIDKYVSIPPGTVIGYDPEEDRKKYFVTENGVVVVAKEQIIPPDPDFRPPINHL